MLSCSLRKLLCLATWNGDDHVGKIAQHLMIHAFVDSSIHNKSSCSVAQLSIYTCTLLRQKQAVMSQPPCDRWQRLEPSCRGLQAALRSSHTISIISLHCYGVARPCIKDGLRQQLLFFSRHFEGQRSNHLLRSTTRPPLAAVFRKEHAAKTNMKYGCQACPGGAFSETQRLMPV